MAKQKFTIDFDTIIDDKTLKTNIEKFFLAYHRHDDRYTSYAVQGIENTLLDTNGYVLCYIGRYSKSLVFPVAFVGENHLLYRWMSFNILGNLSTGEYSFNNGMPCVHYTLSKKYHKKYDMGKKLPRKKKNQLINTKTIKASVKPKRKRRKRNKNNNEKEESKEKETTKIKIGTPKNLPAGVRNPIGWLYTILVTGKYESHFGILKSVDKQYMVYTKWCEKNNLASESKMGWSKALSTINKKAGLKKIYTSVSKCILVDPKNNIKKKLRAFCIVSEEECVDLFCNKYGWKFFCYKP